MGKTSLLHRYTERKFKDTVSTVGGAFFLKQWGPYNISIWDTAGREQFHGLGSMYCRGAAAVILTYDMTSWQSYVELEERFLSLTDTANADCIFAIVGNKADLTESHAQTSNPEEVEGSKPVRTSSSSSLQRKQVNNEDAMALYGRILLYKGLDEKACLPAESMCFETSAKNGYNVDMLFETMFDLVVPSILKKRNEGESSTVDLEAPITGKRAQAGCCA